MFNVFLYVLKLLFVKYRVYKGLIIFIYFFFILLILIFLLKIYILYEMIDLYNI